MKKIVKQIRKIKLSGFIVMGTIIGAIAFLYAFAPIPQSEEWVAPAPAIKKKNPFVINEASIAAGKRIYKNNCYDCHGKKGKGDGPKSGDLEKNPKDFSKAEFQKQTDGSLYWKITEGKKPMPNFKKDLTEEQRWHVINYVRTLEIKK